MNIAYYTCFYGSNNNIAFKIPVIPSSDHNCYFFTNNKKMLNALKSTKWIAVFDDVKTKNVKDKKPNDAAMASKRVKAMPHMYKELTSYDYTCYFDTKLNQKYVNSIGIERYIKELFIDKTRALLLRPHPFLNGDIHNELKEGIKQPRYKVEEQRMELYIARQKQNEYKLVLDKHATTNILIRDMRHPDINKINETWYEHIIECGILCQIPMFFIRQIYSDSIQLINDKILCMK